MTYFAISLNTFIDKPFNNIINSIINSMKRPICTFLFFIINKSTVTKLVSSE